MELSVLVAKIFALTYISAGILALQSKTTFSKIAEDFERSPALTYISGFMALMIGMLLVHYHSIWAQNWTVMITVIGWMALIKGILLIAFPQFISYFKSWYRHTQVWGFVLIAIGLLFGYFGFIH